MSQRTEDRFIAMNMPLGSRHNRRQRRIKRAMARPLLEKTKTQTSLRELTKARRQVRDSQPNNRIPPGPRTGQALARSRQET